MLVFQDLFYTTITVVVLINFIQQSLQVILTYINSTDTGFCCLGISITRWFVHVDFYTKVLVLVRCTGYTQKVYTVCLFVYEG